MPDLKEKLSEDMRQAMKSRDALRTSVLRMLISAINYAESAKMAPLAEGDVYAVIAKQVQQREESIDAFKKGNRPELAAKEEAEMAILKEYQPKQLSHDEIVAEVKAAIAESGAKALTDKGKFMPKLMAKLKGKADGKTINDIVTQILTS